MSTSPLKLEDLKDALKAEGGLFIFYDDFKLAVVLDMDYCDEPEEGVRGPFFHAWMRSAASDARNEATEADLPKVDADKRYVTMINPCRKVHTLVTRPDSFPLINLEGLAEAFFGGHGGWHQTTPGGTDAPEFPPVHLIDAVIGTHGKDPECINGRKVLKRFAFSKNEMWSLAVFGPETVAERGGDPRGYCGTSEIGADKDASGKWREVVVMA